MEEEVDEFGIPIKKDVDEFGIPIKKKSGISASASVGLGVSQQSDVPTAEDRVASAFKSSYEGKYGKSVEKATYQIHPEFVEDFNKEAGARAQAVSDVFNKRTEYKLELLKKKYQAAADSGGDVDEINKQFEEESKLLLDQENKLLNDKIELEYSSIGSAYEEKTKQKALEKKKGATSTQVGDALHGLTKQIYNVGANTLPAAIEAADTETLRVLDIAPQKDGALRFKFNDTPSFANIMGNDVTGAIMDVQRRIDEGEDIEKILQLHSGDESVGNALSETAKSLKGNKDKDVIKSTFATMFNREMGRRKVENLKQIEEQRQDSDELLADVPLTWEEAKATGNYGGYIGGALGQGIGSSLVSIPLGIGTGARAMEYSEAYEVGLKAKASAMSKKYGTEVTPEMLVAAGDDADVIDTAALVGDINGSLETVGMFLGMGKIATAIFGRKLTGAILKKSLGKRVASALGGAAISTAGGAVTEGLQSANTILGGKTLGGGDLGDAAENIFIGAVNKVLGKKVEEGQNIDEAASSITDEEIEEILESIRQGAIAEGTLGTGGEIAGFVKSGRPVYLDRINNNPLTKREAFERIQQGKTEGLQVFNDPEIESMLSGVQEKPVFTENEQGQKVNENALVEPSRSSDALDESGQVSGQDVQIMSTPEEIETFTAEQTAPEKQRLGKVLGAAKTVLGRIVPNLKVAVYNGDEAGSRILTQIGAKDPTMTGFGFYDSKAGTMYINGNDFRADTPFHEAIHPIINTLKIVDPARFQKFTTDAGTIKVKTSEGVIDYLTRNEGNTEEALVEFLGDFASSKYDQNLTIVQKAKQIVANFLSTFGIDPKTLGIDLNNIDDLKGFASGIAKAFKEGKAIELGSPVAGGDVQFSPKTLEAQATEVMTVASNAYPESVPLEPMRDSNGYIKTDPLDDTIRYKKVPYALKNGSVKHISKNIDKAKEKLADKIVSDYNANKDRPEITSAIGWYGKMRDWFQRNFGANIEVFGQILAATSARTPVDENFKQAIDAMRGLAAGRYDALLQKYDKYVKKIEGLSDEELTQRFKKKYPAKKEKDLDKQDFRRMLINEFPDQPKRSNGMLFNANSAKVLQAMYGNWIAQTKGPKTVNFAGNLTGRSTDATIDVWAARYLRRKIYEGNEKKWRILPQQEQGVAHSVLKSGEKTGDYFFAEDVIKKAATKLGIDADDLQAFLWFLEKDVWDKNGWTSQEGAKKSSFEGEAKKLATDRYQGGVTTVLDASNYSKEDFEAARKEITDTIKKINGVVALRNTASEGEYYGVDDQGNEFRSSEPSFDLEFTVDKGVDVTPVLNKIVEIGKRFDQHSILFSKVVDGYANNARAMVEIGLKSPVQSSPVIDKAKEMLSKKGIRGFTIARDGKGRILGLRSQFVPEFEGTDDIAAGNQRFIDAVKSIEKDLAKEPEISYIEKGFVDTIVKFTRDEKESERTTEGSSQGGNETGMAQGETGQQEGSVPDSDQQGGGTDSGGSTTSDRAFPEVADPDVPFSKKGRPEKLNQTAKRIAADEQTIYKGIQHEILSNPQRYMYTPQDLRNKKLDLAGMSDAELVKETESIDKLISNISLNNNFAILSAIEAVNRAVATGQDARPIFDKLRVLGTSVGQLLRQFSELKTGTSAGIFNLIVKHLEAQNKQMTDKQALELQKLADDFIKSNVAEENAHKKFIDNPSDATEKALNDSRDAKDKSFGELNKFVGLVTPMGIDSMIGTVLQGNLLTLKSVIANVAGNALFTPLRQAELLAGDLGAYIGHRIKGRNPVNPLEMWFGAALNGIKGFGSSVPKTVVNAAKGNTSGSNQTLDIRRGLHPFTALWQITTKKGRATLPVNTKGNIPLSLFLEKSLEGTSGIPAELMFRLLYLGDAPFKDAAKKATAFRMFSESGGRGSANFRKFLLNLTPEQLEEMDRRALEATFSDERTLAKIADKTLESIRKSIDVVTEWIPNKAFRDFINTTFHVAQKANVPFVRVPSNLVQYMIELTMPIIPLMAGLRYMKSDARKGSQLIARAGIGFAFLYMADMLINGGAVVAATEGDDDEERQLKYDVAAPNTINISAAQRILLGIQDPENPFKEGDKYVDFSKLGPLGVAMVARAQFREKVKQGGEDYRELAFSEKSIETINAAARSSMELSFLQGTATLINAVKDDGMQSYFAELGNTMTAIAIPNQISAITRARREYVLRAKDKDVLQAFVEKQSVKLFPTIEDNVAGVYPVISMWGKPVVQNKEKGAFGDINPYIKQFFDISNGGVIDDYATTEIYNLSQRLGEVPVTAPSQKIRLGDDEEFTATLSEQDYVQLQMLAGQIKRMNIADIINGEDWKTMTDAEKFEEIKYENEYGNTAAREYILELIEEGIENGSIVLDPEAKTYKYLQPQPFDYHRVDEFVKEEK